MMIPTKYIDVDDFIEKYGAFPASTTITLNDMALALKAQPPAPVIPISFVEEWFSKHYGTTKSALLLDWEQATGQ